MPWTLVHSTNFSAIANVGPVSAGQVLTDGWTDEAGNVWRVVSGKLYTNANQPTGFQSCYFSRLSDPTTQNQRLIIGGMKLAAYYGDVSFGALMRARGPTFNRIEYQFSFSPGSSRIWSAISGIRTPLTSAVNWVASYDASHSYTVEAIATGLNPTTVSYTITDDNTALVVATDSATNSATELQDDDGYPELVLFENNGAVGTINQLSVYTSEGYTAGPLTLLSQNTTTAQLQSSAASGGTAPYSYELHASIESGFTAGPSTLIATNPAFPYSVANPQVLTYYKVKVTDADNNSVFSNELGVGSYLQPFKIGFVGDSITSNSVSGKTPADVCAAALAAMGAVRQVTINNQALSGATAVQWANLFIAGAVENFVLSGVTYVNVMVGSNDARPGNAYSADTYFNALQQICNAITGAGMKVFLCYPPFILPSSADVATDERLVQYQAKIDQLVNGTTIFHGDRLAYTFFGNNQSQLSDGLHPNAAGVNSLGIMWAYAIISSLYPSGGAIVIAGVPDINPGMLPAVRQANIGFWLRQCCIASGRTIPDNLTDVLASDLPGIRDAKISQLLQILAGQDINI